MFNTQECTCLIHKNNFNPTCTGNYLDISRYHLQALAQHVLNFINRQLQRPENSRVYIFIHIILLGTNSVKIGNKLFGV